MTTTANILRGVDLQLISAGLTWFLDGVYVSLPTTASRSLKVTVRLRDATSKLLTTGTYSRVQVCTSLLAALRLKPHQVLVPVKCRVCTLLLHLQGS